MSVSFASPFSFALTHHYPIVRSRKSVTCRRTTTVDDYVIIVPRDGVTGK